MLPCGSDEGCRTLTRSLDAGQQDARIGTARRHRCCDASLVEQNLRGAEGQEGLAVAILVGHELQRLPVSGEQRYPVAPIWQDKRVEQDCS